MASTMQFDLVSPERSFASMTASAVELPGSEGDMTAMPGHAAVMTSLRPGLVRIHARNDVTEFVVSGGFAEVTADGAIVLAERVLPKAEADLAAIEALVAEAELAIKSTEGDRKDLAEKTLADTKQLLVALSL